MSTASVISVHFTSGGPYFAEYEKCDYAQDWFDEQKRMNNVTQREKAAKTA